MDAYFLAGKQHTQSLWLSAKHLTLPVDLKENKMLFSKNASEYLSLQSNIFMLYIFKRHTFYPTFSLDLSKSNTGLGSIILVFAL